VAKLADRQHGVVARRQLRTHGLTSGAINHAVATGRLYRVFRGVFGVGHRPLGPHGRMFAATLACGDGSVLSHRSAAWLLGIWERQPSPIEVIAPVQAGRQIPGIHRRHTPLPPLSDGWTEYGIPCTGPSRTIIDLAGFESERSLRRAIEQAAVLRMLDVAEIDAILDTGRRRRNSRRLRLILDNWRRYSPETRLRSPLEAKLLPLLSRRDIPPPQCNAKLKVGNESFEVDFLWRAQRFVIETDGRRYHGNPEARKRDRHRDRVLAATGYRVWRLTWDDLEKRPEATMNELVRRLNGA